MSLGLDPNATSDLFKDKDGNDLAIESINKTDKTAYLKIDLKIDAKGGQPVPPMTAVFAPDPTQITGEVNVLLWFHGDKNYWNAKGTDSRSFAGKSIQYYLNQLPLCKLREFILQTSQKKFLLVAPTLNDRTGISVGHGNYNPGALQWDQGDAEAYLKQVLKGANKYLGTNAAKVGNIVLAAHSGGGHLQGQMAQHFGGMFSKVNEVWCFDSMYWGSSPFVTWVGKGHSHPRLWVFSTGGTTAINAVTILNLTKPQPPKKVKPAAKNKAIAKIPVVGSAVSSAVSAAQTAAGPVVNLVTDPKLLNTLSTKIEVLIEHNPYNKGNPASTDGTWATYSGPAGGHYEGMQKYLPTLVEQSQNLK